MNLVQALYLNNNVEPFNNEQVRQALCYAIDVDEIMELTAEGHGTKVGTSIYPAFTKYYDESLNDAYPYDTEKAKAMLAEAGYPDGFSMTITVPPTTPPHERGGGHCGAAVPGGHHGHHQPRGVGDLAVRDLHGPGL